MEKFIYQIDKEEIDEKTKIIIYSFDQNLNTVSEVIDAKYSIFIKKEDFENLEIKSDNMFLSDKNFLDKNGEIVVQITLKDKELYSYLLKSLRELNIVSYETDISLQHQYLIENSIKISTFTNKTPKPKVIYLDIESIGKEIDNQDIILLSTYSPEESKNSKVYINVDKISKKNKSSVLKHKYTDFVPIFCENEEELLQKVKEDIISYSPQIILGWNVIDFDFKIIKQRIEHYGMNFNFSKIEGTPKFRISKDFFSKSSLTFPGVLILDVINLLKTNFISFEDYKLNTVAKEVLNDEKIDLEDEESDTNIESKIKAIENLLDKNPIKLIEYNFKDSFLTGKIVEKLKLLDLMMERSILTDTPLLKVQSPIATLDLMYLKKLRKEGKVAETNFNFTETKPIEGAYVIEPKSGYYKNILVFDFKSLYPSIITTFNIDPFTYSKDGPIKSPNGVFFKKKPGILPSIIKKLSSERNTAKVSANQTKSHAIKITMNSFYGAMASPKSRFYNKELAEAITSFGREIIKKAKKYVEENKNFKVIYGDTDSIFIEIPGQKPHDQLLIVGKDLETELNSFFKNWVLTEFDLESNLIIELEKIYSNFFIASKKRYVGFDVLSKKLQITGMEAIRGDWTELAKNFQINLIKLIFDSTDKKEIEKYILKEIDNLKNKKYDSLLVYKKKITKPLKDYTKTTPPHVKVAREIENFSSKIVKYVITVDGPKHISLVNKDTQIDYEHYIEKQLKGVSDDILSAINIDFSEIIFKKKQKSLNSFFK